MLRERRPQRAARPAASALLAPNGPEDCSQTLSYIARHRRLVFASNVLNSRKLVEVEFEFEVRIGIRMDRAMLYVCWLTHEKTWTHKPQSARGVSRKGRSDPE